MILLKICGLMILYLFLLIIFDDDILEYLGTHSKLPNSRDKRQASYVLNKFAYFGQEVNFNDVLQIQSKDTNTNIINGLEELPSLLQKKEELIFLGDELVIVNIGITNEKILVQVGATLHVPQ